MYILIYVCMSRPVREAGLRDINMNILRTLEDNVAAEPHANYYSSRDSYICVYIYTYVCAYMVNCEDTFDKVCRKGAAQWGP